MINTMSYKGYSARIEYDDDDGIFTGRVAGIRDGVGFHADTVASLREAFHEAVEDYLETCATIGKKPQKTFSGQVMFRINPEVHRRAALAAELSGKSLNQWAEEVLDSVANALLRDRKMLVKLGIERTGTTRTSYQNDVLDLSRSESPRKLSDGMILTRPLQGRNTSTPMTPAIRSRDFRWKPKNMPSFVRNAC